MNKIKDYLESVDRAQLKQDLYEIEEGFLDLPPYVRQAIVTLNNRAAHEVCNEMRKHTIDYRDGIRATYSFCEEHNLKAEAAGLKYKMAAIDFFIDIIEDISLRYGVNCECEANEGTNKNKSEDEADGICL